MNRISWICVFVLVAIVNINLVGQTDEKHRNAPVPIFYGPNESQSNSWAQMNSLGDIGMSLFQHTDLESGQGCLLYKTIDPAGIEVVDTITEGTHLELSVLVFDGEDNPHVFYGESSESSQVIYHCQQDDDEWQIEPVIDFEGEGGEFIYECSVDKGPDGSFHLLVLMTRSNPDSDDYYFAFIDSHLYYLTNTSGTWQSELIKVYDTYYTLDEYSKMMNRQDLKVDEDGHAHVIYGEQMGNTMAGSASRLCYTSNKAGQWIFETVADYAPDSRDDAGWYPSLSLDNIGTPHITCTYITRFTTGSAISAKLNYFTRIGDDQWEYETICDSDDGYYGTDGGEYTGGLTHLIFDAQNAPHVVFTDIASSHAGMNYFNLGNIRYATKESGNWVITKIYDQPLPNGNYNATEMYDMCLLKEQSRNGFHIVGHEVVIDNTNEYSFNLLRFSFGDTATSVNDMENGAQIQIFPNPVRGVLCIDLLVEESRNSKIEIYSVEGRKRLFSFEKVLHPGLNQIQNINRYVHPGVYILKIDMDDQKIVQRFLKM